MTGIRPDVSALIGLIIQAILFGTYQVLFIGCLYIFLYHGERINWHFFITAVVMWFLIVLNFSISWSRITDAFIGLQPALQTNPNAISDFFQDLGQWKEIARVFIYILLSAIADILFIYRLYVVWGRQLWITAFPLLLFCASFALGSLATSTISSPDPDQLFSPTLQKFGSAYFISLIVQNVITTCLIIFRIWYIGSGSSSSNEHSLQPLITILVESGMLYSSALSVVLATYLSRSYVQFIAVDIAMPLIGINFNLIIIRVVLGFSQQQGTLVDISLPVFEMTPFQQQATRASNFTSQTHQLFHHQHQHQHLCSNCHRSTRNLHRQTSTSCFDACHCLAAPHCHSLLSRRNTCTSGKQTDYNILDAPPYTPTQTACSISAPAENNVKDNLGKAEENLNGDDIDAGNLSGDISLALAVVRDLA